MNDINDGAQRNGAERDVSLITFSFHFVRVQELETATLGINQPKWIPWCVNSTRVRKQSRTVESGRAKWRWRVCPMRH